MSADRERLARDLATHYALTLDEARRRLNAAVPSPWPFAAGLRAAADTEFIEKIALAFRVPYWLVTTPVGPAPSWFKRPVWRVRAVLWSLR